MDLIWYFGGSPNGKQIPLAQVGMHLGTHPMKCLVFCSHKVSVYLCLGTHPMKYLVFRRHKVSVLCFFWVLTL
jgi:hypothetical protein